MIPGPDSAADFDDAPLGDVEKAIPRDQFIAFIEDYLASAERHLERASSMHAVGDLAALGAEAHTLISVTGSYGLRRASALARELRRPARRATPSARPC